MLQRQAAADGFDFGKFGHRKMAGDARLGLLFLPDECARDKRQPGRAEADFGFRRVPEEAKAPLVRAVFDSVAGALRSDERSDERRHPPLVEGRDGRAGSSPRPGQRLIDVAGGTGDIAGGR